MNSGVNSSSFVEATDGQPGFGLVTSTDPFADTPRLTQLQFRSDTIPASLISPIQISTMVLSAAASVPDGSSITNTTVSTAINGETIIQEVASQIYIGSIDPSNRMPEVISSSSYPHYSWSSLDDGQGNSLATSQDKTSYKRQVRNNSGSVQTIIFQVLVKYIINKSDNLSSL